MNKEEINSLNDRIIAILGKITDLHSEGEGKNLKNSKEIVRLAKTLITFSQRDRDSQEGLSKEDVQRQYQLLGEFYHLVEQDSKEISAIAFEANFIEDIDKEAEKISALKVTPEVNKKIDLSKFKTAFKKELKRKKTSASLSELGYEVRLKSYLAQKLVESLNATDSNNIKSAPFESAINQAYKMAQEERVDPNNRQRLQIIANTILTRGYLNQQQSATTQ